MKAPREHGFWVMLGVTLAMGSALGRSMATVVVAIVLAAGSVAAAIVVGRKIRKNSLLQMSAAPLFAGLVVPLAVVGRCSFEWACFYSGALALVFLSTTLSVQAILLRARRQQMNARLSSGAAVALAAFALLGLALAGPFLRTFLAASFAPVLLVGMWLAVRPPSAKKLRWVGLSIAAVQLLAAGALVANELSPLLSPL